MISTPPLSAEAEAASPLIDRKLITGYVLLLVSFCTFFLCDYLEPENKTAGFSLFLLHYLIALGYTLVLYLDQALGFVNSFKRENLSKTIILLNLFLISAYALNREIPVFEDSTDWFCAYLVSVSLTMLSFHYFICLPTWVNKLQLLLLGSAFFLFAYLALFVSNYYIFGSIGTIAFGIGVHIFVPIFILITLFLTAKYYNDEGSHYYSWILAGFVFTLTVVSVYVWVWNSRVKQIEKLANQSVLYDSELPVWLKIGQSISNDWITHRILKSDLVYTTQKDKFNEFRLMPQTSWDEHRKHDPLVFLATLFAECNFRAEDRIKIIQSLSDTRHQANERLWPGANLKTSYIVSDIDVYPALRLAYTEKYLTIKNHSKQRGWWNDSEEAIYTFQLPEGSVVTSLSLWIEGKEEKAILTSKQKATNAYQTIVGVQRRDPSVVHWQEGNTVSVRVFPCTNEEERKFKIGITSLLTEQNGKLVYKSIRFKGPSPTKTKETIRVRVVGEPKDVSLPKGFLQNQKGDYVFESAYNSSFEFEMKAVSLFAGNQFLFDGYRHSMSLYHPTIQKSSFDKIYLDINQHWTNNELNVLRGLLKQKEVFVFNDVEFIQLNSENWQLVDDLQTRNYSIFPFHLIQDTNHSLVISKGSIQSPHLVDFKESKLAVGLENFFGNGKRISVYNLGVTSSAYISSLREFRAFEFASGTVEELKTLLTNNEFPKAIETDEEVILHDAKLVLKKQREKDTTLISNAPDHLARLFAYNHIMRKVGRHYFQQNFVNEELVDEATSAYVVSPVSSLIVLESKEDYKRFNIEDKENSLHNAAKQSSGAVPEPHEWALIILLALFALYVKFSTRSDA